MATKQTAKLKAKSTGKMNWKLLAAGGILLLIIGIQSLFIYKLYSMESGADTATIRTLIVEAARAQGRYGVVEPLSGKTYLPEHKLVLPAQKDAPVIKYIDGDKDGILIQDTTAVTAAASKVLSVGVGVRDAGKSLKASFDQVPALQACTRQLVLRYQQMDDKETALAYTKTLADGRTLYIYQNPACQAHSDRLLDYFKQVDSY